MDGQWLLRLSSRLPSGHEHPVGDQLRSKLLDAKLSVLGFQLHELQLPIDRELLLLCSKRPVVEHSSDHVFARHCEPLWPKLLPISSLCLRHSGCEQLPKWRLLPFDIGRKLCGALFKYTGSRALWLATTQLHCQFLGNHGLWLWILVQSGKCWRWANHPVKTAETARSSMLKTRPVVLLMYGTTIKTKPIH